MLRRVTTAAACLVAVASAKTHIQAKIRSGAIASRATNLGGWLLSEYWMCFTSPLYTDVPESVGLSGEYAVMQHLGKEQGDKQFEEHWASFITEDDVAEIAKTGLNTIRVSTGFWIINDEDTTDQSDLTKAYPSGGLKYLDTLVNEWAVTYNLAVMVSLHAHRGSQNGMDHSAPEKTGVTGWMADPANIESSLNYAKFIAHRYKNSPAFLGLNLMNEPTQPIEYGPLLKYYMDAYTAIRADGNDCIIVTSPLLSDQGPQTMADFLNCPTYYNVWHEWHLYYKWGWEQVTKEDLFIQAANYSTSHFEPWTGNPLFMGEWSLATADQIQLTKAELKKFATTQLEQHEKAHAGWAFWAWRHDEETKKDPSGWSMRQLLKEGLIPIPTTEPTRTPDPKCPVIESTSTSSASVDSSASVGDGSEVGSASDASGSIEPVEEKTATVAPATTTAPVPATSAASHQTPLSSAGVVALASCLVAWAAL